MWILRVLLLIVALVGTSCLPPPPAVVDGGSIQVNSGDLHWESSDFPIWLLIDDQLPLTYQTATLDAANNWNDALGVQVFEAVLYDHSLPAPRQDGFIVVKMKELGASARHTRLMGLARAHVHKNTSHMRIGQVWFDEDLPRHLLLIIMEHELGHSLTLAHDLLRLGYAVDVYEMMQLPGGMLTYGVPNYRLKNDIVFNECYAIEYLGAKIYYNMKV